MSLAAAAEVQACGPLFVSGSCLTPGLVDPVLAHGEVGQNEFGFNHVRITYGVNASVHMCDVNIFEASDNVEDGIHFADVRQEFVPETFALTGPLHDARNVDQPNRGGDDFWVGILASMRASRGSGTSTIPTFGSMVQNG